MKEKRLEKFFRKAKLDRRITAALLFVLAAAGILLVLRIYSMKQITTLEFDASAISEDAVLSRLREGTYEMGETVWLEQMEEGEPVYRRGGRWYVGESKRSFDGTAPVYVNDGTYIWLLTDGAEMITDEWLKETTAAGMYISDGASFNFDGSSTGDAPIYFLKLSSGLFLNTMSLQIDGSSVGTMYLPANSYLDFQETGIYYLARQSGEKLIYSEIPASMGTTVTLDGENMTYEQLLYRLGILGGEDGVPAAPYTGTEEEPEPEELPKEETDGTKDRGDTSREEDAEDTQDETAGLEEGAGGQRPSAGQDSAQATAPAAGGAVSGGGAASDGGSGDNASGGDSSASGDSASAGDDSSPGSGDASGEGGQGDSSEPDGSQGEPGQGTDGTPGEQPGQPGAGGTEEDEGTDLPSGDGGDGTEDTEGEPSDDGSEDTEGGEEGSGSGEPSGSHGDGDSQGGGSAGTGSGGSSTGAGNPPVWVKPSAYVAYEDEDVSIYTLEAALQVTDTYGCFDRVVVTMSWDRENPYDTPDGSTPVQLRRTLREPGDFYVDNLPPQEKIYVAAYLYYYEEDGTKIQESEPFQTFVIETGRFEEIAPVSIQFSDAIRDSAENYYYENQIALYDFGISGSNGNSVDKVYSARLYVYERGSDTPVYEEGFSLSSGVLSGYKWKLEGDYKTLTSQFLLPAHTEYRYRLEFFDRYGNSFNDHGKVLWGNTQQENPEDYVRADGYGQEGTLYAPTTDHPWEDPHDQVGESSFYWGYTHTSKTVPKANMETAANSDKLTTLTEIEVHMNVEDIHEALTPMEQQGIPEGWLGMPPEQDGEPYRVYFMLYASSTGYDAGKELYFVYADDNGQPSLRIGEETASGYVAYNADTPGAGQYAYARSGSLPDGTGGDSWLFQGLTAGETYMIRVFASYDLNDNHPELTRDVEIGNMRFSTTPMSSYGRVFYQFTSMHVNTDQPEGVVSYDHGLYESSTAQQINMEISTSRTAANLVKEFFSRVDLELKYRSGTKETLASFTLERKTLSEKEVRVESTDLTDGRYRYLLTPGEDYAGNAQGILRMPEVYLDIPVTDLFTPQQAQTGEYYMVNLWDAFTGVKSDGTYAPNMPVLQFCFGEDSLTSYTAYTLSSVSTAEQGGREHTVTASSSSARQSSFTTLKDMPYITMDDMLQVGRYLYLVGLDFHDEDQSIFQGAVNITNTDQVTGSVTTLPFELDYEVSEGGYIAKVDISGLREGRAYQLDIVPEDIRRTGRTTAPRYEDESLYTYAYTAGDGVSGQIRMQGLSYPVDQLSKDDVHVLTEYNKYEVGEFEYGTPQISDGTVSYNTANTSWQTAKPISVSPGEIYYLNKLHASSEVHLVFLDSNSAPVGIVRNISNSCYLEIPEGVNYLQFSMGGTLTAADGRTGVYAATQAQALKIHDEDDAALSSLNLVETLEEVDGRYQAAQGDLLAVVNGEWVNAHQSSNAAVPITFTEYDAAGNKVGGDDLSWRPGSYYEVKNAKTASVEISFSQVFLYDAQGNAAEWDVRKIDKANADVFADLDLDRLVTSYTAIVNDKAGSLYGSAQDNIIVNVWKTDNTTGETELLGDGISYTDRITEYDQQTDGSGLIQYVNGRYNEARSFISDTGCVYKIQLSIVWRGEEYVLDTQEIESTGNVYTIATGKQLLKTVTWPTGSFIVLDDLEVDENTRAMLNQNFSGSLDGKGYSLSVTLSGRSHFLFNVVTSSGVIENLEVRLSLDGRTNGGYLLYTGFVGTNRGTIRNIVMRYNLGPGNYKHDNGGGICRYNVGTVENFAVYFEPEGSGTSRNVWGANMGGVCYYNKGTVRNGVVYSASALMVSTGVYGGSTDISLNSTGGAVGTNASGGVVENVFAILDMRVEQNAASPAITSAMNHGLLVGSNSGMIRNCFTNGEIYYQTWEEDVSGSLMRINSSTNAYRSWPGSNAQGRNYQENCYYFSTGAYQKNDVYTQFISVPAALRSQAFYDSSVNQSAAFVVDSQIAEGYYPIVNMPACMDGVQDNISLSRAGFGAFPTYLASNVIKRSQYMEGMDAPAVYYEGDVLSADEGQLLMNSAFGQKVEDWTVYLESQEDGTYKVLQQFALTEFIFTNSGGYNITRINVDNLTAARLTQTDLEDSTSIVTALLTPGDWNNVNPASYSNSYQLRSFGYGYGEGDVGLEAQVTSRFVNVKFYYPLSQKSWSYAPADSNVVVNYRMIEDIRLGAEDMTLAAQTKFYNVTLLGEFDGGGHTLDYSGVPAQSYFFYQLGAGSVMKDLRVENLNLGSGTGTYVGLIRRVESNAALQGIHMKDVTLQNAYQYAGCLAAYMQNAQIKDCTVAGAQISSHTNASGLYVGGLVGVSASGTNLVIKNSFVRGLDMRLTQGDSISGAGGIIGYMFLASDVAYPVISSCYAEGEIHTNFSICGGIAGRCNGEISSCWSDVDIYGSKNMGSIAGYVLISGVNNYNYHSNVVASGELYTSSGTVENRLMGGWEGNAQRIPQSYAYSGQLLNSEPSTELMDVSALADAETMSEYYFWNDQLALGESWHLYGTTAEGYGTEIPDVKDAYVYPILYTEDGTELLPDQTAIYYEKEKPDFAVKSATAEKTGSENNGTYDLTVTLQLGGIETGADLKEYFETYMKDQTGAEGLTLLPENPVIALAGGADAVNADVVLSRSTMERTDQDGVATEIPCLEAVYQKVEAVNRWDSYRITYDNGAGSISQKVVFQSPDASASADAPADVYLYWDIENTDDWNKLIVNGEHGSTYENFRILSDLNFNSGTNVGQGLKMNRLEGGSSPDENYELQSKSWVTKPEFITIKNFTVNSGSLPWISEITGELKYLGLDSIALRTSTAASNLGLVGQLTGNAEYVDFSNISISPGSGTDTYSNLGCIGYSLGSIANCRAANIRISGQSSSYYYSNVGGVAGYARDIADVYAFGTADGSYQITMGNDTNLARSYFGGIAGYVSSVGRGLYGENLSVTGRQYTGGLVGYLYSGTDNGVKTEQAEYQAVNVKVRGYLNAGGIFGQSYTVGNARTVNGEVTSVTDYAGGVMGYAVSNAYYCEAYDTKVTAERNSAGGIAGVDRYGVVYFAKAAGVEVAAENQAGGILGSCYALIHGCAVGEGSGRSVITATEDYAGGIIGQMYQHTSGYATSNLRYNAVSGTDISSNTFSGGIAGSVNCAEICYNETDDSVKVKASNSYAGGIAGIISGGRTHHNIAGADVYSPNYTGGIAGGAVGYGRSTSSGGTVPAGYNVMQMYNNVTGNIQVSGTNYVAGLIGCFQPGDRVYDPETGNDISEESGWTQYMSRENFYGNTISAGDITSSRSSIRTLSWYANYATEGSSYTSGGAAVTPRYDCLGDWLKDKTNLQLPVTTSGTRGKEEGLTAVADTALKTSAFYTDALSSGGMGFDTRYTNTDDVAIYYPYVKAPSFTEKGSAGVEIQTPYQSADGNAYNCTWSAGADGAVSSEAFDGNGIPIAASSTNALALFDLNAAQNIAYASGINTLNLDFTHIDSTMIGFKVLDAYGRTLVPDTTLESAAGTGKVCTIDYDYQTDIVVVLYSADYMEQKTYPYLAKQLRNSVMAWGDDYYYLSSDGVYKGTGDGETELVEAGDFVHLFGGQALTKDGQAVDLQ